MLHTARREEHGRSYLALRRPHWSSVCDRLHLLGGFPNGEHVEPDGMGEDVSCPVECGRHTVGIRTTPGWHLDRPWSCDCRGRLRAPDGRGQDEFGGLSRGYLPRLLRLSTFPLELFRDNPHGIHLGNPG